MPKATLHDTDGEIFSVRFDPEDRYLACGYGDGAVRVFNLDTGKLAFNLTGNAISHNIFDEMPVTGLRWRP